MIRGDTFDAIEFGGPANFWERKKNWGKEIMWPSSSAFLAVPISKKEDNGFSEKKLIFRHYPNTFYSLIW